MVRRHLLAALDAGITAGDDDTARRALAPIDPVLRLPARRRLERLLIDAALETGALTATTDAAATRHVLQVASLRLQGANDIEPADAAGVARAYAARPPAPAPSRRPIVTAGIAIALGLVAGVAITEAASAGDDHRSWARVLPPPSVGAYRDGGTPLADAALEAALRDELAELIVATDRAANKTGANDPDRVRVHQKLRVHPAIAAHGNALATEWSALVDTLDRWVHLDGPTDRAWDRLTIELRARARAVSDQLAARGLGYYIDGDVLLAGGMRHAIVFAYRVEHVAFVQAGSRRQRVLGLRRLDHISLRRAQLGMQSEELGDPVLLLDQIDEHVAVFLLGTLADDSWYPLGDGRWRNTWRGRELAAAAGAAVRAELGAALGPDADAARQVGYPTTQRAELLGRWHDYLSLKRLSLRPPDAALLPRGYLASLAPAIPEEERARMAQLDAEMRAYGVPRIAARIHDIVAATVRRHEAQHALDADRELALPASLQVMVGPLYDRGMKSRLAHLARIELSAYLSQIASDPVTPQLSLWALARSAFDKSRADRPEAFVAAVVIAGLGRELGVPSPGVVFHEGKLDRDRLAQIAFSLAKAPPDRLRAAAGRLWHEMFGARYVPIVDAR